MDKIDQVIAGVKTLPPTPRTLAQVLGALSQPDSNLDRVVDMISFDPALTAKLVQVCNSAFYARSAPVNDVAEAVRRLGFQTVYRVVAAVGIAPCFRPSRATGLDAARLWRHSATVAFASQFVGEDFESQSGLTFTAGVLHDIGKLILAEAYQWDYAAVLNKSSRRNQPLADLEKATFGVDHAEVGARLLERWHFTPQMVASVRYHHAPLGAGELRRLAACINLGDTLAHSSGEDRAIHDFESDVAVTILGLGAEDVFRHRDRIKENLEFVEVMCRLRD